MIRPLNAYLCVCSVLFVYTSFYLCTIKLRSYLSSYYFTKIHTKYKKETKITNSLINSGLTRRTGSRVAEQHARMRALPGPFARLAASVSACWSALVVRRADRPTHASVLGRYIGVCVLTRGATPIVIYNNMEIIESE